MPGFPAGYSNATYGPLFQVCPHHPKDQREPERDVSRLFLRRTSATLCPYSRTRSWRSSASSEGALVESQPCTFGFRVTLLLFREMNPGILWHRINVHASVLACPCTFSCPRGCRPWSPVPRHCELEDVRALPSAFVFSADLHVLSLCDNPKRACIRKNISKDYGGDGGRFPVEELTMGRTCHMLYRL
jgi:hypothetical protein